MMSDEDENGYTGDGARQIWLMPTKGLNAEGYGLCLSPKMMRRCFEWICQ
jgi:hypothetical protein